MDVFRLLGMIGLDVDPYTAGLHEAERETEKASRTLGDKLGSRLKITEQQLKDVGNAAKNLGNVLSIGLTAPLLALAGAGVRSAMQLETFAASLEVLIGDAERANAVFDQLYEFSAQTPFDWKSVSEATRSLAAYQIEAEHIVSTLSALGDVAAGLQTPITDLAEIYGRVHVTGRLGMEEVNRLADRGVPVFTELAKIMNVTEGEVRDLVSSGVVGFPEMQRMFVNLTSEGGMFAGMMAAQLETTEGKLAFLKDTFEQVTDSIGERLLPVLNNLIAWLQQGVDWFNNLSEEQKDTIIVVGGLAAALGPVLAIVGRLILALPTLRTQIAAVRAAMTAALGPLALLVAAGTALYLAWRNNWLGIRDVTQSVTEWIGKAVNTIVQFGRSFIRNWDLVKFTVVAIWEAMGAAARYAGMLIVAGFEMAIAQVQGAFAVMGAAIRKLFSEAVNGVIRGLNWLVDKAGGMFDFLGISVGRIQELQVETWDDVTGRMAQATEDAQFKIEWAQGGIRRAFAQTGTLVQQTYDTIVDGMASVEDAGEALDEAFTVPPLGDLITDVDGLTGSVDALTEATGELTEAEETLEEARARREQERADRVADLQAAAAAAAWREYYESRLEGERLLAEDIEARAAAEAEAAAAEEARRQAAADRRAARATAERDRLLIDAQLQYQNSRLEGQRLAEEEAAAAAAAKEARLARREATQAAAAEQARIDAQLEYQNSRLEGERLVQEALAATAAAEEEARLAEEARRQAAADRREEREEAEATRIAVEAWREYYESRLEGERLLAEQEEERAAAAAEAERLRQQALDRRTTTLLQGQASLREEEDALQAQHGARPDWDAIRERQREEQLAEAMAAEAERVAQQEALAAQEAAAAERRAAIIDGFTGRIEEVTKNAVPAFGAALDGFATGGPLGALTSMLGELLVNSDAFKSILESANAVFEPLVKAIGKVLTALQPVIDVALALVDAALQPLVAILTHVVAPVFEFVAKVVAGIWNAIARAINAILGWAGVRLQLIDLNRTSASPKQDEMGDPKDPFEPMEEQSFHTTGQSVQLAVATPLVEASYMMLQAATMQRDLFAGIATSPAGFGFDALPPFTEALRVATPVLDRLAREGIRIELTGPGTPGLSSATTGAFR